MARVKGRTENALLASAGEGRALKDGWCQAFYTIDAPLYPVLHRLFPQVSTTTASLGRALIHVAAEGYSKPISIFA